MSHLTNYAGFDFWLHTLLVNRALKKNLHAIKTHECSICDMSFGMNPAAQNDNANALFVRELAHLQELAATDLKREIDGGLIN
jgi:hypothetical protein